MAGESADTVEVTPDEHYNEAIEGSACSVSAPGATGTVAPWLLGLLGAALLRRRR